MSNYKPVPICLTVTFFQYFSCFKLTGRLSKFSHIYFLLSGLGFVQSQESGGLLLHGIKTVLVLNMNQNMNLHNPPPQL